MDGRLESQYGSGWATSSADCCEDAVGVARPPVGPPSRGGSGDAWRSRCRSNPCRSGLRCSPVFYEGTLGLQPVMEFPDWSPTQVRQHRTMVLSVGDFADTNEATAATWGVGDDSTRSFETSGPKGVTFEHYDLPDTTRDGDVHEMGDGMPRRVVQRPQRQHHQPGQPDLTSSRYARGHARVEIPACDRAYQLQSTSAG